MPHPLQLQIGVVRCRARRLLLLYALSRVAGVVLAAATALVLADYLIHFQDRGVRILALAVLFGLGGWAGYRFLWTALFAAFSDVALALKIERRFPELADRLASTVQFLGQREDDPRAGSAVLRRAVIAETSAAVERLDLSKSLEPRPAYRALLVFGCVASLALLLAACGPRTTMIGLTRLVDPLGNATWPKSSHLVFKHPVERVALGQPFEVEVIDAEGAPLPDEVFLHVRYHGDGTMRSEQVETMRLLDGAMTLRKDSVTRPFAYRAVGGDDDSMPWIDLEVVEPPAVEQLTLSLHYPDYTGWPSGRSEPHIRALVGTRVELVAATTKPLRSAVLRVENGEAIPARLADDGYGFSLPGSRDAPFVVQKSGSYWFELTDREGFAGGQQVRYEIRAVDDLAPSVAIEEPAANVYVTADAVVPLRIVAKDDLAIRSVATHYSRTDKTDEGETAVVLYDGPERVARPEGAGPLSEAEQGESRRIEHGWDLRPLGLKPGAQLTIFAVAADYKPQLGRSPPRRLTIITPDELQDRLAERQEFILGELARVLKLEQEARGEVSGLEIQLRTVGRFEKQDVDHLQSTELTQRQVERGLTGESEGVITHIDGLLADLANNKVDSPEIERHMRALLDEINALGDGPLPAAARELTAALKAGQEQTAQSLLAQSLTGAAAGQDQVIQSLEKMLGELSQWDNYRRFHRELGQLRREQEGLNDETAAVGRETLTKDIKELDSQRQADLKKLAGRQFDIARRFDKIQQRMERMVGELDTSDPLTAGTIADALDLARRQAVASKMREAGRRVDENQVGQAAARQGQVAEDLREMLDILANRREHELARLVKKLREAERKLAGLRERQEGLRKKWEKEAENPAEPERRREQERLARQQRELQSETERFARALARLRADAAGRDAARGGSKMGQAGRQGDQGDSQSAADNAAEAQRDLEDAQQQLAADRRQAEADLAQEQLARLEDGLKGIADQERRLIEETRHYRERQESQGELTAAETRTVGDLARQQRSLGDETEGVAAQITAAVFQLGLKLAAREMYRAVDLLAQLDLGGDAQGSEERALARLEQLLEALKPDVGDDPSRQPPPGGEGGGGDGGPQSPGDALHALAELKLLKLMQDQLNLRTEAVDDAARGMLPLSPEQRKAYLELSEEQGQLADLLLELSQPAGEKPEDDPEKLPDLDEPELAEPDGKETAE
ncbi:MAG TPA: hypothetical protein VMV69_00645 [Pirellulales bacterium]|nr:hypothetical protein [Pirellulales bacterium]